MAAKTTTAFISGHMDLSYEQFIQEYESTIYEAYVNGYSFVMGHADGVDTYAREYLLGYPNFDPRRITIYVHFSSKTPAQTRQEEVAKLTALNVNLVQDEYASFTDRDAAMTANSDYDILYIRTPEEMHAILGDKYDPTRLSGTEQNRIRRLKATS